MLFRSQGIIDTYIPSGTYQTLSILAVGLLIAYVFNSIFSYGQNFLLNVLGQRLSIDLNLQYIRHIFELPMEFFVTRRTGEITSRFSDASRIIDALASTVISLFLIDHIFFEGVAGIINIIHSDGSVAWIDFTATFIYRHEDRLYTA